MCCRVRVVEAEQPAEAVVGTTSQSSNALLLAPRPGAVTEEVSKG